MARVLIKVMSIARLWIGTIVGLTPSTVVNLSGDVLALAKPLAAGGANTYTSFFLL